MSDNSAMLSFRYFESFFSNLSEPVVPDFGMYKPQGEYLVTGSFYSDGKVPRPEGYVYIQLGPQEKTLKIKGPRKWSYGVQSEPAPITSLPIDYHHAFGGAEFPQNPIGMGYKDGMLPCIEDPNHQILSKTDQPKPAGFSPLDSSWPQRMRFQGSFNRQYLKSYFPGYPPDFDWRFFMCAPEDQWAQDFYLGYEPYEIHHMHPDIPVIQGRLPGFIIRCFLQHTLNGPRPEFAELPLHLDTVWFLPEKLLVLLFWRGMVEVTDDEATQISCIMAAYEDRKKIPRDHAHYLEAFRRRMDTDDALLNTFNTQDLIPDGDKCAMELLQEAALENEEDSAFSRNMDAKSESIRAMAEEKVEESIQTAEKNMVSTDSPGTDRIDLRKMSAEASDIPPDADTQALNQKLEAILPGVTAGDPKKIQLKNFSFDQVDDLMEAVSEFADQKEKQAMAMIQPELHQARIRIAEQLDTAGPRIPQKAETKIQDSLKAIEKMNSDIEEKPRSPLPRLNVEAILSELSFAAPQMAEALQHIEGLKSSGAASEQVEKLETQMRGMLQSPDSEIGDGIRQAASDFKEAYILGAHFMDEGISPHEAPEDEIAERLLRAVAAGEDVSGQDWACIDLSGRNLDGIDLSGAFLEQVNFRGVSLKGADLRGAIMVRAVLENADLTGANLAGANIGGAAARGAVFTEADLKGAVLSRGDFFEADFTRCDLEEAETREIRIAGANFSRAFMPGMVFIETRIQDAVFNGADLSSAFFNECTIVNVDFTGALLSRITWTDVRLENVDFEGADLSGACFAGTDPEKIGFQNVRFAGARLDSANFQDMPLEGALFSGSSMENALFNGADLKGADLSFAQAKSAQFRKANLTGARADYINLMEGSLSKADLTGASFEGANLYGADLLRAVIDDTNFTDSNQDATILAGEG